jgi:hypothetical protein
MCWNQYVSINTFIFGIFGILFIVYNNKYSIYKIKGFSIYFYIFALSVVFMQLVEFILWRNLNNPVINNIASIFGYLLLYIQPIASLFVVNNIPLRNKLLAIYSIPIGIFMIYDMLTSKITDIHTTLTPKGHLSWKWPFFKTNVHRFLFVPYYLFFLFFSFVYNKYYFPLWFLAIYFILLYVFGKDGSAGSIWCLTANVGILYYLLKILVIMPLYEIINS